MYKLFILLVQFHQIFNQLNSNKFFVQINLIYYLTHHNQIIYIKYIFEDNIANNCNAWIQTKGNQIIYIKYIFQNNIANNCNTIWAKAPVGSKIADKYPTGLFGPK